ncbi:hypothetical protein H4I95_07434 [Botrytis cinerea]
MNSETLVKRGTMEILNKQPLTNINNVWQESFASGKAASPIFFEPRNFPPKVPTIHRKPEGGETREGYACPHRRTITAVASSSTSPTVQRPLPENRLGASKNPLQALASSIVQGNSLPENSTSSSQNPVHANTTIPIVQHSQVASSDYADPRKVPGTDQNIYPRAPIKPEFQERYPQLVDFFKQAVDAHKSLKYHTSKINYELRLCGSNPANAVASVIIFCAEALFKCLSSLLGNKHIRRQYQLTIPSLLDKLQFTPSKPRLQVSAPTVVPFNIVYWRARTTPTQRRSAEEQVVTSNHSFLTMCGSLVKYGDRTSTLGILISMESKLYGLTVDHLFKNQRGEEQPTIENEPEVLPDEDDSEDSEPEWPWIDDVKYEDIENVEWVSDIESVSSEGSHAKLTIDHGPTEHYGESVNGHKADPLSEIDTTTAYLDWALIEFDDGYYERPNALFSQDDPAKPKFLETLSAAPKTSEVKIFMISGVSGTRKGVLLSSSSYIGGKPSEDLCQAWNVILSDSSGVIDGDCGSLVVDQETLEVYGHVVASNPLGEAYVVPLRNTFHQISTAFGAKDLSLPNPGLLMKRLVTHYSQEDDSGVADEAKQILASMEGPVSTFTPGSLSGPKQPLVDETVRTLISIGLSNPSSSAHDKRPFFHQSNIENHADEIALAARALRDGDRQEVHEYRRHRFQPINTAEQYPPKGFKRLCLGTEQNGPMCFVEFEDVAFATKCTQEINGTSLQNSTKGGIWLSFSKNPLGVRSSPFQPAEGVIPSRVSLNDGNRKSDWDSYIAVNTQDLMGAETLSGGIYGHEYGYEFVAPTPTFRMDLSIAAELGRNNTSTQHRTFDPHYRLCSAREFRFGKVFKVLWSESTDNARGGTKLSVRHRHGEAIYAKVRMFVIVTPRQGHCVCLPIMTYEGRATSKPGVHADEHAIIYTTPVPKLIENEDGTKMTYRPVKMIPESNRHKLEAASRINYHKIYTVDYNVKVWFIGIIDRGSEQTVRETFDQAHPPLSQSTQAFTPSSYYASNSAYSSSPYTPSDTSSTIPSLKTASKKPVTLG